ncbi:MAG TPA: hypothetical protein VHN14_33585 [Kofleriaceae bacterium]|nr:hypothetical protein [Kofleriaceae bacterium]
MVQRNVPPPVGGPLKRRPTGRRLSPVEIAAFADGGGQMFTLFEASGSPR